MRKGTLPTFLQINHAYKKTRMVVSMLEYMLMWMLLYQLILLSIILLIYMH